MTRTLTRLILGLLSCPSSMSTSLAGHPKQPRTLMLSVDQQGHIDIQSEVLYVRIENQLWFKVLIYRLVNHEG